MFKKIDGVSIQDALTKTTRQYLTGQLKLPQELGHIDDGNVEIGITEYKNYTPEAPHWHKVAYEYQYMISGETKYIDVETGEEMYYAAGDFFRIEPHTKYAQKSKESTTILFIKTPPGNDKVSMDTSDDVKAWLEDWARTI